MLEILDWLRVILMTGCAIIGVLILLFALFGGETDRGDKG